MNDAEFQERTLLHHTYDVSYNDLIQAWLAIFAERSHCFVIYDPQTHIDHIMSLGLDLDHTRLYQDKVLVVEVADIEDAVALCHKTPHETGPYVQVWTNSEFLTDNIEN